MTTTGLGMAAAVTSRGRSEAAARPRHVVLLGDSIFDNKSYVGDQPAVIDQVRAALPSGDRATLLAVDGDVAADVAAQLERLPADATHLVVSIGGNDALQSQHLLDAPVDRVAQAFLKLQPAQAAFGQRYRAMLDTLRAHGLPTAVCSIYDPNFDDPVRQQVSRTALALFNDEIARAAFSAGVPMIDLRLIFGSPADYANAIEPGPKGGAKIAAEIVRLIGKHDFTAGRSAIFGRSIGS